jgi:hypothetical protein
MREPVGKMGLKWIPSSMTASWEKRTRPWNIRRNGTGKKICGGHTFPSN